MMNMRQPEPTAPAAPTADVAQLEAFGALLEWVGRTIERGGQWIWKRVRGR
jgi:hypothetical protein